MVIANLSKVSFKARLEKYYSVVAPETILSSSDNSSSSSSSSGAGGDGSWIARFDAIYLKYGGSIESEEALKKKLMKKYGSFELLEIVVMPTPPVLGNGRQKLNAVSETMSFPDEPSDETLLNETGSKILDPCDPLFDSYWALTCNDLPSTSFSEIPTQLQSDSSILSLSQGGALLDNVEKCRQFLTPGDRYYVKPHTTNHPNNSKRQKVVGNPNTTTSSGTNPKSTKVSDIPSLQSMAHQFLNTPLSTLHSALINRTKISVLVRYGNCIRGSVEGRVLGFDKHFNIILGGAVERYSGRYVEAASLEPSPSLEPSSSSSQPFSSPSKAIPKSQTEIEISRRSNGHSKGLKTRNLKQILIRGDNVVSCRKI
jgi:small nuclear ribonucleoprotein (snRNP)-like protein